MSKKIGISCGDITRRYGGIRSLEICAASGFDAVDFDLHSGIESDDIHTKSDQEVIEYCNGIKKRADELGLIISQTHGLCTTFIPNDEMHNATVLEQSRRDLLATSALGAPSCVIHSITTSKWFGASDETMHKTNNEMFSMLIPYAERYGVNIALETFGDIRRDGNRYIDFFGDVYELKKQYDMLDTKNKVLCMDTGHTHKANSAKPSVLDTVEAIHYLGSDIKLLHLNDNNGFSDQHLPPFLAGDSLQLKWKNVMAALDDIGYDGIYNFELLLGRTGAMMDDYVHFLGAYLRKFINGEI